MLRARGDERGFIHKRAFRAIKGAVGGVFGGPGGIVGGAIGGFLGGGGGPSIDTRCPPGQVFNTARGCIKIPGSPQALALNIAAIPSRVDTSCPPGFVFNTSRGCIARTAGPTVTVDPLAFLPGGAPFVSVRGRANGREFSGATAQEAGPLTAVMGRYGAGFEPDVFSSVTRRCGRGAVLGNDGICYNKRDISNKEREWPRGRRPLLTGGDMRCISVASRAAKKLQSKQKQLRELGFLKPAAAPRSKKAPTHVVVAPVAHN